MRDEWWQPAIGRWKHVGWLMQAIADCCDAGDPVRAIVAFVREDPSLSQDHDPVSRRVVRTLRLGAVKRRDLLVHFLDTQGPARPNGL